MCFAEAAYKKYEPLLRQYFRWRFHDEPLVKDLTHEVFERFVAVKDARKIADPLRYLYGIAAHVVADHLRKRKRDLLVCNSTLADHMDRHPVRSVADPVAQAVVARDQTLYHLKRLPRNKPFALIVTYHVKHGLPFTAIARQLNLGVGTVRTYYCDAMRQLRKMKDEDPHCTSIGEPELQLDPSHSIGKE